MYHAYRIYRESEEAREAVESRLVAIGGPKLLLLEKIECIKSSSRVRYLVRLKNISDMTMRNCSVRVLGLAYCGGADAISLKAVEKGGSAKVDLRPGDDQLFALCEVLERSIAIQGPEGDTHLNLEPQSLTVRVTADEMTSSDRDLLIDPLKQCVRFSPAKQS
jgi:hypothetical protein